MARSDIPTYCKLLQAIKFNGGGHMNHEFFWETLAPISEGGGELPDKASDLMSLLDRDFGSLVAFQQLFNKETALIQGSGWGWLAYNRDAK